jgi:hypothetical protein
LKQFNIFKDILLYSIKMLILLYIYFLFMIGYSFIYIHLTIIETQFITYKTNVNNIFDKINVKFDIFEDIELYDLKLMNKKLDTITL